MNLLAAIVDRLVVLFYMALFSLMLVPVAVFMVLLAVADYLDRWLGYDEDGNLNE